MRKFYIALFSLFFFISLVGCQSKAEDPLEFSGETQSWSATITLYPVENSKEIAQMNLNYLGGEVESVGDFGINLDTSNNQNGIAVRDARLNREGNFKEKVKVDASKDVIKPEYMILTVKWNEKSEDIILKVK
ncbi:MULTISPECIES: hypothetical protein [Priestia]|jgi:hypothetical protein|uniref:Uncharacterized protein n=1 Tax=Priestia megaterium TaxID=1404 RepID=A0AAE5UBZ7_PRIMG|nr:MULTISPECIES: hypothetical protein [Priestia]RFB40258.1 hypothetical protein DZB86_05300 [Bacillus sp. RC]MBM6601155.1 hypothetical protein [Priestia megaterium]MBV6735900.1 hypothetical protein [Priestia megaterium]MCA4156414.1 hypothetical protein [Priestia megaterium]MCR8864488.1 hypothetical protein [Priestia megaterium]